MSAAFGSLESPAAWRSGAAGDSAGRDWAPDRQACGDPGPYRRAERAQGLRGNGSRLSKGFQPDHRAGIRSRSLRAPRPHTLILLELLTLIGMEPFLDGAEGGHEQV